MRRTGGSSGFTGAQPSPEPTRPGESGYSTRDQRVKSLRRPPHPALAACLECPEAPASRRIAPLGSPHGDEYHAGATTQATRQRRELPHKPSPPRDPTTPPTEPRCLRQLGHRSPPDAPLWLNPVTIVPRRSMTQRSRMRQRHWIFGAFPDSPLISQAFPESAPTLQGDATERHSNAYQLWQKSLESIWARPTPAWP